MTPLDLISPFSAPVDEDLSARAGGAVHCRIVASANERDLHWRIREAVFVREQRLFALSDRDEHDDESQTLHVLGCYGRMAAGTVRLYPLDETGLWKGDRLGVLPGFRQHGLGRPLVRFAVKTAGALGGREMIAHIQLPNIPFFERLGWRSSGEPVDYVGHPHQRMTIGLQPPG
ncbi:MAG: MSMEG_0567/Sll0786 family nitrogen starvation N-acetyltransferase [Egibacteraceae bacterium]